MKRRLLATITGVCLAAALSSAPAATASPAMGPMQILAMLVGFSSQGLPPLPAIVSPGIGATTPHPAPPAPPVTTPQLNGQPASTLVPETVPGVGQPIVVGHATGTVCQKTTAYGVRAIIAGPNTSCPFAIDTFAKSMTGANPKANVHFSSDRTLSVASAATGRTYHMRCAEHDKTLFICKATDGATAQVWAF